VKASSFIIIYCIYFKFCNNRFYLNDTVMAIYILQTTSNIVTVSIYQCNWVIISNRKSTILEEVNSIIYNKIRKIQTTLIDT